MKVRTPLDKTDSFHVDLIYRWMNKHSCILCSYLVFSKQKYSFHHINLFNKWSNFLSSWTSSLFIPTPPTPIFEVSKFCHFQVTVLGASFAFSKSGTFTLWISNGMLISIFNCLKTNSINSLQVFCHNSMDATNMKVQVLKVL